MDIRLKGDMDGVQAAETIWNSSIPVVYSTYADKDTVERAKITGAFYIIKPFEKKDLYVVIDCSTAVSIE